jgi:VanZ family protein
MAMIFYFSSRTATESTSQSDSILNWLTDIFGDNVFTNFIVRKTAHCLEFAGLGFLFNIALYFTTTKKQIIISIALTSAYAVTDEIHQLFVEGRSCEVTDWAIDTAGAIIGTIVFVIMCAIITKIVKKTKNSVDITNKQ